MAKNDLKLLDCTLRDGGYVNNWNWLKLDSLEMWKNIIQILRYAIISKS